MKTKQVGHMISSSVTKMIVDDIYALLGYYPAYCGNTLPTFRDNLSVSYSRDKK